MHCPQWDSFSTKIFVLWCPSRVHPQMAVILTIYRPLEDILSAHTFDEMMYADDTQLYIFMRKVCHVNALENRTLCLDDITSWNLNNNLDCTVSKTEIIHFSLQFSLVELIASITVGDHYVQSTSVVKDLGVMLESVESCTCLHSFAFILFYWQNQKISFAN